ncbi:MAG: hypothetical protein CYPHOPRED_004512 [Cyphobasidiales sp. Tagirdzhanova-0007]|nr:MAG: hypothetical protein CYPHOPRED_004512 [Cyphobasidiales sp. Tagirdzhanova-0007]
MQQVAAAFIRRTADTVQRRTQQLDANQLCKLAVTLGSRARSDTACEVAPPLDTALPPGWHLVYFTPSFQEEALGPDGSDRSFNPDPPFTRRMWAGGRLKWDTHSPLRIGQTVTEHTKVVKAEPKTNKHGGEMILAGVEKQYETQDGVVLTDQREWVFLPELSDQGSSSSKSGERTQPSIRRYATTSPTIASRSHVQTAVSLFRFSALTFNGHKIHYSLPWVRDVEGHREIVVHAPLNLVLMLELYRSVHGEGKPPASMEYRAVSPIYAHEEYVIHLAESGEVWCEKRLDGALCLTGRIL